MSAAPMQKYELSASLTFDQVKPFLSERCIKGMREMHHDKHFADFFKEQGVLIKSFFHKYDNIHAVTFHAQYTDSLKLTGIFIRVISKCGFDADSEMVVWNSSQRKLLTVSGKRVTIDKFSPEEKTPRDISQFLSDLIDDCFAIIDEESERPKFSFSPAVSTDSDSLKKISKFFGDFREAIPSNIRDQISSYTERT